MCRLAQRGRVHRLDLVTWDERECALCNIMVKKRWRLSVLSASRALIVVSGSERK
jgi:hypothetical protein